MVKSPMQEDLWKKNAKTSKIQGQIANGKITHTRLIENWQYKQNYSPIRKWQNHSYLHWTRGKMGKWARVQTGSKVAKSPILKLWKNGKKSKIPDQYEYLKITHTSPLEKRQNKQNPNPSQIWHNHPYYTYKKWQNEQNSGSNIAKSPQPNLLKKGKTSRSTQWVENDKNTHPRQMEKR